MQSLDVRGVSHATTTSGGPATSTDSGLDTADTHRSWEPYQDRGGGDGGGRKASCLNPNMTFQLPAGFSIAGHPGTDVQRGSQEEACVDMHTHDNLEQKGGCDAKQGVQVKSEEEVRLLRQLVHLSDTAACFSPRLSLRCIIDHCLTLACMPCSARQPLWTCHQAAGWFCKASFLQHIRRKAAQSRTNEPPANRLALRPPGAPQRCRWPRAACRVAARLGDATDAPLSRWSPRPWPQ